MTRRALAVVAVVVALVALRRWRDALADARLMLLDPDEHEAGVPGTWVSWGVWGSPPNCHEVCSLRGIEHRHTPRSLSALN